MSKHTKWDWILKNNKIYGKGFHPLICEMATGASKAKELQANGKRIIKCVNNFDELIKMLEDTRDYIQGNMISLPLSLKIKQVLKKMENK